jgi:saccharopine dehydrogenase-like NADP-dependent oxidoreductase
MAHRIIILGAGKIGSAIAKFLHHCGDYAVFVGDSDPAALARLKAALPVETAQVDVTDVTALEARLRSFETVVSACAFSVNPGIARAALAAGCSYFDLTEDVRTTRVIRELAAAAKPGQIFMPQCGLAPGFIGILGHHLTTGFERLDTLRMRVGALPEFPSNMLKYNLTWSTDGLINEYCNPCEAIYEGRRIDMLPLEGLEQFNLDGVDYEAFNTSGGLGTLCETLDGQLRTMDYKTVRYPGHRQLITFLVDTLRLSERRGVLKDIMEQSLPITLQDVVLVFATVTGWRGGYLEQVSDVRKIYHREVHGELWSAIQVTTAAGLCAVVDLHREGRLPKQGFVRQEDVKFPDVMANRFGKYYTPHKSASGVPAA